MWTKRHCIGCGRDRKLWFSEPADKCFYCELDVLLPIANKAYDKAVSRCNHLPFYKRNRVKVECTRNEFVSRYMSAYREFTTNFPDLRPSLDRIDSSFGYRLGNMRIIDVLENNARKRTNFSDAVVREIRRYPLGNGVTQKMLAEWYNTSEKVVSNIRTYKTYQYLSLLRPSQSVILEGEYPRLVVRRSRIGLN